MSGGDPVKEAWRLIGETQRALLESQEGWNRRFAEHRADWDQRLAETRARHETHMAALRAHVERITRDVNGLRTAVQSEGQTDDANAGTADG